MKENSNSNNVNKQVSSNKNSLILCLIGVIIILSALLIYFAFIKKDDVNKTDNQSNNQNNVVNTDNQGGNEKKIENIKKYEYEEYKEVERKTYNAKDGKNKLTIVPRDDANAIKGANKNEVFRNSETHEHDAFAYYNNKLYEVVEIDKNGKYLIFRANEVGEYGQCGWNYSFIVNYDTGELVNLNNEYDHGIIHINDNYYFTDSSCIFQYINIYNENLKKIGTKYLGHDDKYFYILDNNIVKYNSNGEIVDKTNETYKEEYFDSQLYNGVLYIVLNDSNNVYFVDTSDYKRIKIGTTNELNYGGFDFYCFEEASDGKLNITFHEKGNYTYDIKTKELTKVAN